MQQPDLNRLRHMLDAAKEAIAYNTRSALGKLQSTSNADFTATTFLDEVRLASRQWR
jgi:hypothetical protein